MPPVAALSDLFSDSFAASGGELGACGFVAGFAVTGANAAAFGGVLASLGAATADAVPSG